MPFDAAVTPHQQSQFTSNVALTVLLFSASEKREAMEKKLRAKLEDEVKELRSALSAQRLAASADSSDAIFANAAGHTGSTASAESLEELRRKFSEAEEKVSQAFSYHLFNKYKISQENNQIDLPLIMRKLKGYVRN